MLRRLLWRRQRPFTCIDVDANVEQVRDGRLSARETAAFKAHVAECNACRQRLKTETAWLATLQATPAPARLTPHERRAMQQALGRQMRRGMMMRNIRLSVQQVAVFGVLALVVGAMVWWQTADTPKNSENLLLATPSLSESSDSTTVQSIVTDEREIDESLPPALSSTETVTIRFAVQDFEVAYYNRLSEAFEAENPGIKIELVSSDQLLNEPGDNQALRLAQAADVFSSLYAPSENNSGIVRDLTPFIEADLSLEVADFYPNALQRKRGQLFVLPTSLHFGLIFYNRALFDATGVAYPEPGWTWEDFRDRANALTVRANNEIVQWGFVKPTPGWSSFIEGRLNKRLIDTSTSPATLRFQDDDVLAVVQSYVNLAQEDEAAVYADEVDESVQSLFGPYPESLLIENNQAAMWPEGYTSSVPLDESYTLDWGVVPYPGNSPDDPTTLVVPYGLVMSAGTAQPEAAWQWMVFLSRQKPVSFFGNALPARISVAEASGYWDNLPPELSEAMQYALAHSFAIDTFAAYTPLQEAIQAVLAGEKSAEIALAEAQVAAEAILAETAVTQNPAPFTVEVSETENSDRVIINFTVFRDMDREKYREFAEAFTQENNAFQINIQSSSSSGDFSFNSQVTNSDCFQWSSITYEPDYRLMVISLDPLIDADPDFSFSDFYPFLVEQFQSQGQLWGLPGSVQLTLIEYNKALFDAANVPYPSLTWTTDEFLQTAVALTDQVGGEPEQYGFVVDAFENTFLLEMLVHLGAPLIDNSHTPSTLSFNDPAMVEAMRWYTDLSLVHGVKPAFGIGHIDDIDARQQLIGQEQAAMWTTLGFDVGFSIPGYEALQIGIAPLPTNSEAAASLFPANGFYISANTDKVQGCWEWIKFLTYQPNLSTGLPARRSVAESAAYAQSVGEERALANLQSIENVTDSTVFRLYAGDNRWLSVGLTWLQQAYTEVINREASVEQALETAQQTFDAYRACIVEGNGFTDTEVQNQCAAEVGGE